MFYFFCSFLILSFLCVHDDSGLSAFKCFMDSMSKISEPNLFRTKFSVPSLLPSSACITVCSWIWDHCSGAQFRYSMYKNVEKNQKRFLSDKIHVTFFVVSCQCMSALVVSDSNGLEYRMSKKIKDIFFRTKFTCRFIWPPAGARPLCLLLISMGSDVECRKKSKRFSVGQNFSEGYEKCYSNHPAHIFGSGCIWQLKKDGRQPSSGNLPSF